MDVQFLAGDVVQRSLYRIKEAPPPLDAVVSKWSVDLVSHNVKHAGRRFLSATTRTEALTSSVSAAHVT